MNFSSAFSYILSLKLSGFKEGSTGLWSNRVNKLYGLCREKFCPSDPSTGEESFTNTYISGNAYLDGYMSRIDCYQRVYSIEDCMKLLDEESPLSFCFDLFENAHTAQKGNIQYPKIGEPLLGSHSVSIIDYSENLKLFRLINSWGHKWGDGGFGTLPFSYIEDGLVSEIWNFQIMKNNFISEIYSGNIKTKNGYRIKINHSTYIPARSDIEFIHSIDVYSSGNIAMGYCQFVINNKTNIEIEELYLLPQYHRRGIGTVILKYIEKYSEDNNVFNIIGWISSQDLINNQEKNVISFFEKNKFKIKKDSSRFRDAYYKFEKNIN